MARTLVADNFAVPQRLIHERFVLRPLTIHDVVKDYDAVISSAQRIHGVLGPDTDWPPEDLTLEQDLIDLGWHQREFQTRRSFAYTMMSPDESRCLGCVYIYGSDLPAYDAMVVMWVRDDAYQQGLDDILFVTVKSWIDQHWPFASVAYPGRETDWRECNSL